MRFYERNYEGASHAKFGNDAVLHCTCSVQGFFIWKKLTQKHPLAVVVTCDGINTCFFENNDVVANAMVTNNSNTDAHFPLASYLKQGSIIALRDNASGKTTQVRRGMARPDLKDQLTVLAPGTSIEFRVKIPMSSIEMVSNGPVDLVARLTVWQITDQVIGRDPIEFYGIATFKIMQAP